MDSTRSVRQGQIEIGIIEHEGHEFSAFGATVCGRPDHCIPQVQAGAFLADDVGRWDHAELSQ